MGLVDLLKQDTVGSIVGSQTLVTALADDYVGPTIAKLHRHHVLSLPVKHRVTDEWIGMVSMTDLVAEVVRLHEERAHDYLQRFAIANELRDTKLDKVVNASSRDNFVPVKRTDKLFQAARCMSVFSLHRMPVTDTSGKVEALLTQSALLGWIHKHKGDFGPMGELPVNKWENAGTILDEKRLVSVHLDAKAIQAFRFLVDQQVSAVPIVDDNQRLINCISVRDIRAIGEDAKRLHDLYTMTAQQFAMTSRAKANEEKTGPISVAPDATYAQVVEKLVENKIHRVFVEENYRVVGVIALRDLLHQTLHGHVKK